MRARRWVVVLVVLGLGAGIMGPAAGTRDTGGVIGMAVVRSAAAGDDGRVFTVLSVSERRGEMPVRRGEAAAGEIVVDGLDASGTLLSSFRMPDPHVRRLEQSDDHGVMHGVHEQAPLTRFTVPFAPGASSLRIQRVLPGGTLETLGSAAIGAAAGGVAATAWPAATIRDNGPSKNRMDFVVVAEGYTAGEMGKFAADAARFFDGSFLQEPYREYERYFNVHRLDVASNQSGADHPERAEFKDTAFDATYYCSGIDRLICVDQAKVQAAVAAAFPPEKIDQIVVLVNDPTYGGSGGQVAVSSTHAAGVELVLHEVAHSFGLLGDEYSDFWVTCNPAVEPAWPNVTRETNRNAIKWKHWIEPSTMVPTVSNSGPGLYSGAAYCPAGLWRPTDNSKMRTLGRPFEQINTEQLVKRTYSYVSPIDSVVPAASMVEIPVGGSVTFTIKTPMPRTHDLTVFWTLDGRAVGFGNPLKVPYDALPPSTHPVWYPLVATVWDDTPWVRSDPGNLLRATHTWQVRFPWS